MERQIVCFRIPSFQIAVARLEDSSIRDRAVAVARDSSRAILIEVSTEAEAEGLFAGMPLGQARFLCRSVRIIPPDSRLAFMAHQSLLDLAGHFSPLWEPIKPGHLFLDLTGTFALFGPAVDCAARMEREVHRRWSLSGAVGLGNNKLVSDIAAALINPAELCAVRPGTESNFLAPLPVASLPGLFRLYAGRTTEILNSLEDLNLQTLGEIAAISPGHLELALGPQATLVRQWALGIDPSPVSPPIRHGSVAFSHVLETDEMDDHRLLALLYYLLERLCYRLRVEKRLCGRFQLTLGHSDGKEISRRLKLNSPTCWEAEIYPPLRELFYRSFTRRVVLRTLTISAEDLNHQEEQLDFLSMEESENESSARRLSVALDRLRERHGKAILGWAG